MQNLWILGGLCHEWGSHLSASPLTGCLGKGHLVDPKTWRNRCRLHLLNIAGWFSLLRHWKLKEGCSPRNARPGRWQFREAQVFWVPLSADSLLHQGPFIIFYFTLIPLSWLHSQTPQPYPVLFSDTIPFTIAGSPSGNIHRVLLCFHPQRTKHALSARDDFIPD